MYFEIYVLKIDNVNVGYDFEMLSTSSFITYKHYDASWKSV